MSRTITVLTEKLLITFLIDNPPYSTQHPRPVSLRAYNIFRTRRAVFNWDLPNYYHPIMCVHTAHSFRFRNFLENTKYSVNNSTVVVELTIFKKSISKKKKK